MGLDGTLRQNLMKHLAALSLGLGGSMLAVSTELTQIPDQVLEDVLDETEAPSSWAGTDRARLFELLARDPRSTVRRHIAELVTSSPFALGAQQTEPLLALLARDERPAVRSAAADALAHYLESVDPLERTAVIGEWSTADAVGQRWTIARVLKRETTALGVDYALATLAADPVAAVRREAAEALPPQMALNPDLLGPAWRKLLDDPNAAVRRSAARAVSEVTSA